jgi:calmodulin
MASDVTSYSDDALREQFRVLDEDQDGFLTADELATFLRADGAEVSDDEIAEILRNADGVRDGHLSFEEFRAAMNMSADD